MRVIGVDPGLAVTGFGIIDNINNTISAHSYGTIRPPKGVQLAARLGYLFDEITTLIDKYKPEILAIEDTFYHKNFKSAMVLGQARGTIILAGFKQNIPCVEFAPKKIKKFDGGLLTFDYGYSAKKNQNTLQSVKKHKYTNLFYLQYLYFELHFLYYLWNLYRSSNYCKFLWKHHFFLKKNNVLNLKYFSTV